MCKLPTENTAVYSVGDFLLSIAHGFIFTTAYGYWVVFHQLNYTKKRAFCTANVVVWLAFFRYFITAP